MALRRVGEKAREAALTIPPDARSWIEAVTGSSVRSAVELDGATTATVLRLDLEDGRRIVAKRFDRQDFLDERPDRAGHEATVLGLLERTAVPAPVLIAFDADGSETGAPLVLSTWVEGSTDLPADWVDAMASNLADIHGVEPGPIAWKYERYNAGFDLAAPSWASDRGIWSEAFSIAAAQPPGTATGFIHRDYHEGNLLWRGGVIVAVLDWLSGCVGPFAVDLAHLRTNLAMDHHIDAADAVLAAYRQVGPAGAWHPVWDVIDAVDMLPYYEGQQAVEEWRWDDRPATETQARFDRLLGLAVRRSGFR
jgi:aminoglycoside phosphotransferase (APT) family kinase protein